MHTKASTAVLGGTGDVGSGLADLLGCRYGQTLFTIDSRRHFHPHIAATDGA